MAFRTPKTRKSGGGGGGGYRDDDDNRRTRGRFDQELVPYIVAFAVLVMIVFAYNASLGSVSGDARSASRAAGCVGDDNDSACIVEGATAVSTVERMERAFLNTVDSVENEIIDFAEKLTHRSHHDDAKAVRSSTGGGGNLDAQGFYADVMSTITESNNRVAALIMDIDSRLQNIEESLTEHADNHDHLHDHLHDIAGDVIIGNADAASSTDASMPRRRGELEHTHLNRDVLDGVHFVLTSNGNMYSNWQTRFCYYSFQRVMHAEGSVLKKFTRILHRSADDELMDEIPTFRVMPEQPECERWCDFPVNDRPRAVYEWLLHDNFSKNRYKYVMMGEPDYVFVRPITAFHLPPPGEATAFRFGYINPDYPTIRSITTRIYNNATISANKDERYVQNNDIKRVPGTGPAPVIIEASKLIELTPLWEEFTKAVENDADAKKEFGWVREMYGYSFAAGKHGLKHNMLSVPDGNLMSQPPADQRILDHTAVLHYTWGAEFHKGSSDGEMVWQFDKRLFSGGLPHHALPMPPNNADDLFLQVRITKGAIFPPSLSARTYTRAWTYVLALVANRARCRPCILSSRSFF